MTIDGALFSSTVLWLFGLIYGITLLTALRIAPWARLRDSEQLHVFLGLTVALLMLWQMQAKVLPGLSFHLLGVTIATLMFGWSLAIISASLALFGVVLNAGGGWDGFALNALVSAAMPISLTLILLILIRWYLPKHFFIYVLVNGFFTAGFVGLVNGFFAIWLLVLSGAYSFASLQQTVLPFFPLMVLPEAMLNGWIMTLLVALRPGWVYSFSDQLYLKGK